SGRVNHSLTAGGLTLTGSQTAECVSCRRLLQVVLEADPYRRLAYTSQVSFDPEQVGEQIRLTVVHGGFEPGSTVLQMINNGWPKLLSDLKTLLEIETTAAAR
ncbi:SRPBCC domain-containing protein, partial [Pseudonocardia sp. GCM10023141]|uniref:SRPBCC domain-containing protein n=1 Tax=Pseudonocardia sp. GCM10023141 TaxID=3252653 RepID=UPI00361C1730